MADPPSTFNTGANQDATGFSRPEAEPVNEQAYKTLVKRLKAGEEAAFDLVARAPLSQQNDILELFGAGADSPTDLVEATAAMQQAKAGIKAARGRAFRDGLLLEGVDATGGGTDLSKEDRQGVIQGSAIEGSTQVYQDLIQDPSNYSIEDVEDEGAGYQLADKLGKFDEDVDPLVLAQEQIIEQIRSNEEGRVGERSALSGLQGLAGQYQGAIDQGGLTAIDRARVEALRQDTARRARAQEEAILADMTEKGRGSGLASMLLRQQAQQSAADQRGLYDAQVGAMGLERKDRLMAGLGDAYTEAGTLGHGMQEADDAIDSFNAENRQEVSSRNTDRDNVGRTTTWGQNRTNENSNVTQGNTVATIQFGEDSARATRNANLERGADIYNTGPGQGERGRFQDSLAGQAAISGDIHTAAEVLSAGADRDSAEAIASSEQDASQLESLLGAGAAVVSPVAGAAASDLYEDDDDDDDDD